MDLIARIKAACDASALAREDIARLCEVTPAALSFWLSGAKAPRRRNLQKLAQVLGVDAAWLEFGNQEAYITYRSFTSSQAIAYVARQFFDAGYSLYIVTCDGNKHSILAIAITDDVKRIEIINEVAIETIGELVANSLIAKRIVLNKNEASRFLNGQISATDILENWQNRAQLIAHNSNYAYLIDKELPQIDAARGVVIPRLSAVASLGAGVPDDIDHDTIMSHIIVSPAWLKQNLLSVTSQKNIVMITGDGDSMSPTIRHGDVVFVDIGIKTLNADALYVFNYKNSLFVKRLQRTEKGIIVKSDNKKYKSFVLDIAQEFLILGRVVGVWHYNNLCNDL